ncbi:helix-turn-helix domain-containing protein [Flavobacterium sp.]|uniref:helix-turn-helix domain-containing protein n=1 Tax=Flavobacterium sp. TaxID=239 RepID=UPI00374FF683
MNLGENIRKIRIEKDKKQQEIYDAIGVNQSTYSKIENNKYKMDIETLRNIANVLEVDVSKLIGEDKIEIKHTNNDNSSGGSGIVVTNNYSEELINSLKEQITLYCKINLKLEEENKFLKERLKN